MHGDMLTKDASRKLVDELIHREAKATTEATEIQDIIDERVGRRLTKEDLDALIKDLIRQERAIKTKLAVT